MLRIKSTGEGDPHSKADGRKMCDSCHCCVSDSKLRGLEQSRTIRVQFCVPQLTTGFLWAYVQVVPPPPHVLFWNREDDPAPSRLPVCRALPEHRCSPFPRHQPSSNLCLALFSILKLWLYWTHKMIYDDLPISGHLTCNLHYSLPHNLTYL